MHYYQFHPADYTLDTVHLDDAHDLAYRRLLDFYYTSEAPIPKETQRVAIRLRLGSDVVSDVLNEFFKETENGWIHGRCDAQIAEYHAKAEIARANGKRGGRPSTACNQPPKQKKTHRVNLANPEVTGLEPDRNPIATGSKANQEPRTINHKPKTNGKGTRQELESFAEEIGQPASDGSAMFDHWESNGWMAGRNPIRNWKAGMRTWHAKGWLASQRQPQLFGNRQQSTSAIYTGKRL